MASTKSKGRRKPAPSHPTRPALEEEDWETKRTRILREHFARSNGYVTESEDEDENWERTQMEQKRHEADPAAAIQRLRELWTERDSGQSNNELKDLCGSFHYYADVLEQYSQQDNLTAKGTVGGLFRVWKALYDSGLPAVCTMIAQDDALFNENKDIVNAIMAISSGIVTWGASIVPVDFGGWSTMPGALGLVRAICPNIWAHRDLLLGEGPTFGDQNRLRLDVAKLLFELSLVPDSREFDDDPPDIGLEELEKRERLRADALVVKFETRSLAFFCWVNGSPPNDLNRAFIGRDDYTIPPGLSDTLLGDVTDSLDHYPDGSNGAVVAVSSAAFINDEIMGMYGAAKFFTRINASLHESRLGRALMLLLNHLGNLSNHPLLQPHTMEHGTFLAIRAAVDRQALQNGSEYEHYIVLREALHIYSPTLMLRTAEETAYLIRDCNIVELIARYIRLYALLGHTEATWEDNGRNDMYMPLQHAQVYASIAKEMNTRNGKNALRKAMRHALRQVWYSTLHVLRTERRDSAHWKGTHRFRIVALEQEWVALGEGVSLDEEAERKDYEQKPIDSLQTCKGCGQVKYCSRACQKLDWKEGRHKVRCGNRLTEG